MIGPRRQQSGLLPLLISIALHAVVILAIVGGAGYLYHAETETKLSPQPIEKKLIVHAATVNESKVQGEIAAIKARRAARREAALALQAKAAEAKQQLTALTQQQQAFEQQATKQRQQAKANLEALQQQTALQRQQAEQQLAKLRQQTQQQKQRAQAVQLQLTKSRHQLAQLHKQQQHLNQKNAKVSTQLQQTKQALKMEQSMLVKKRLQHQLALEQAEQKALQQQQQLNTLMRYKTLILKAIGQKWIIPPHVNPQATSVLLVTLSSDGSVEQVQILKSSGNATLDRSAVAAVYKASPLPVPESPQLLKQFSQLKLTVKPEGLLNVSSYKGSAL